MLLITKYVLWIFNQRGEAETATVKVSLFASAVRVPFYPLFLKSLEGTTEEIEVVFAGHNTKEEIKDLFPNKNVFHLGIGTNGNSGVMSVVSGFNFKYIHTSRIKPAQCYEIARRYCKGETIAWTADDAEHTPDLYGKAYRFWKSLNDAKKILSIQTEENMQYCDMRVHSFFGCQFHTPLMAPLALMSREYCDRLGGLDRRYICGQYENDIVMNAVADGGLVEIFGDKENKIILDHYRRHGIVRPFATGYEHDRSILEGSWTDGKGKVNPKLVRNDLHEPYEDKDLLIKSQSFNNKNLWV